MKHVILMGAQGAGKGTQAERIAPKVHLSHLSTGALFRTSIANDSEIGRLAKGFLDRGELVPDEITIGIVDQRLDDLADCARQGEDVRGALFDGFPRTAGQAIALEKALRARSDDIAAVIEIRVPVEELVVRLSGRRVCPNCGATYHLTYSPPAEDGVCDRCGSKLIQRADDTAEAIERRLELYVEQTEPLLRYYRDRGLVKLIDGQQTVDVVTDQLISVLNGAGIEE